MADAETLAHEALLKATEALTRVASHEMECARRYMEGATQNATQHAENVGKIEKLDKKVDALLEQGNQAKGRRETNQMLFSGLSGAFWLIVLQLLSTGVVATLTVLTIKGKI